MGNERFLTLPRRDECKFAVLGSGKTLCNFIRLLKQNGFFGPAVMTHPKEEHERDRKLYSNSPYFEDIYEDVFTVAAEHKLNLYESKNVNEPRALEWLASQEVNVALSVGCRSIIRKNFLEFFEGRVLNYHASNLPRYQGGGAVSWQILNGDTPHVAGTLHMIEEGIDTGDILLQQNQPTGTSNPYPADLFRESVGVAQNVLSQLVERIVNGQPLTRIAQATVESTYFPRLNTETHGAIDWRWSADSIERFIRAFGYPYPGAWTYVRSAKVSVGRAVLPEAPSKFHPFLAGLIFREYDGGEVEVATGDGSLIIVSLRSDHDEIPASSQLKVGGRLHTPIADIEEALSHRHIY